MEMIAFYTLILALWGLGSIRYSRTWTLRFVAALVVVGFAGFAWEVLQRL